MWLRPSPGTGATAPRATAPPPRETVPPPRATAPARGALLRLGVLLSLGGLLAGCDPPSDLGETPVSAPAPATPTGLSPTGPTLPPPPAPASPPTGFPEDRAVDCAGDPGAEELLAFLREQEVLGEDDEATVPDGPLCAGTWQYAVVGVPDRDPLQVVTRGDPEALELVTRGTDVCTVDVRVFAPPGIQTAAGCVG